MSHSVLVCATHFIVFLFVFSLNESQWFFSILGECKFCFLISPLYNAGGGLLNIVSVSIFSHNSCFS